MMKDTKKWLIIKLNQNIKNSEINVNNYNG